MKLFDVLSNSENKLRTYNDFIMYKTISNDIPYTALLELSPVCNLDCQMCYIRMTEDEVKKSGNHIMRFDEWKYYIDSFCDMGVMNLTLTGGECTLHPDFAEIYSYAYDKGLQVSLITNGSCLNEKLFELFLNKPPRAISLTIYGTSEETYKKFCRNGAAYKKVVENIDRLVSMKILPGLQYTCGNDNLDDFEDAFLFAKGKGLDFIFVGDFLNFNKCDADKIAFAKLEDEERFNQIAKKIQCRRFNITEEEFDDNRSKLTEIDPSKPILTKGIGCNAGHNSCTVNWQGKMKPCIALDAFALDPRENGGVEKCWHEITEWVSNLPRIIECQTCIFYNRCKHCTAFHYGDTHEFGKVSPRLCFKKTHPEEAARLQAEYDKTHKKD